MDETVAYVEGFLSAFFYSPVEEPQAGDRAWISHLKGFTKEFETASLNSGPLPKNRTGVSESAIATRQSANAVLPESEKLVNEYCDAAGESRRKNLAAWMQRLYKSGGHARRRAEDDLQGGDEGQDDARAEAVGRSLSKKSPRPGDGRGHFAGSSPARSTAVPDAAPVL